MTFRGAPDAITTSPRTDPQPVLARTHFRAAGPLPKYLFRSGSTLYFKRKIPADVAHGLPECKGQMWKFLGTSLLEKARVALAVEVAEFDLKVAALRCDLALRPAAVRSDLQGGALRPGRC
jgi:hypothetical protein